jgi:hypothetical protein
MSIGCITSWCDGIKMRVCDVCVGFDESDVININDYFDSNVDSD